MAQKQTPPRSLDTDLPTRWLALEQVFAENRYAGSPKGLDGLLTGSGVAWTAPAPGLIEVTGALRPEIVVTAAHATNHVRAGTDKLADRGTGGLALLLAELTGCSALVAISDLARAPGDANHDAEHPLKERLADLSPDMVVDLHGMRTRAESDVDLGTGTGTTPAAVVDALTGSDLRVTTDAVFDAMRRTTITTFAQQLGIAAVQVEIGAHLRPPAGTAEALTQLAAALVSAVGRTNAPAALHLTAIPARIPSGLRTAVVHPDVLSGIDGPVPVSAVVGDRTVVAWAWSSAADGIPKDLCDLEPGQIGVGRLLREAAGDARSLSVHVPAVLPLRTMAALARDMPDADEVQVNPEDLAAGTYLLVQDGVTAWVRATPRAHVGKGSVRLAYQLRLLTASDKPAPDPRVALVAAPREAIEHDTKVAFHRRVAGAVGHTTEHLWRTLFRAPEFSARVVQAHAGDDGAPVVTLHPAVFDRIGIGPGQQVLVRWGGREVSALAVADHDPPATGAPPPSIKKVQRVNQLWPRLPEGMSPHVVVRMSARLRTELGAPVATVVTVRRQLRPVVVRNLNSLVVPLASLVLAGAALPDPHWPILGLGTALMSVFALARLRIPQPRDRARVDEKWVEQMPTRTETHAPGARSGGEKVGG